MRHLRLTWLAATLLLTACAQLGCNRVFSSDPFRGHTSFRETSDAKGLEAVVIATRNGSIQVRGDETATAIEIKGEKWARGETQEAADELTGRIQIQIQPDPARPDRLQITAVFPEAPGHTMGTDFEITLPPTIAVEARSSNGGLTVSDTRRDVRVETSNGGIDVIKTGGNLDANTRNGHILARDVTGNVDAHSTNGRITIERAGKDKVSAETSNGSINALDARGAVTLISSNGSIGLRATSSVDNPQVKVATSNASILVELPKDVKATLAMATSNASVDADLDGLQVSNLHSGRGSLNAILNGGGGSIDIRSSNGSVKFRPLPASRPG